LGKHRVKTLAELILTFVFASSSAAFVAYSLAHIAHYDLGIPSSDIRNQALTSAILISGLLAVDLLATRNR
jgi:hypothetical protein